MVSLEIVIDGMKMNYNVSGQGRDMILLHGWGGSVKSFEPVHRCMEKHFRVYSLDLPGFGGSQEPPDVWGSEEYSNFVNKFLDKLNIENPILVGHSFGGKICIRVATLRKVNKVILIGSTGIKPKRKPKYYFKVYSFKLAKNIFKLPFLRKYSDSVIEKFKKRNGSTDYKNASGIMQRILVKSVNEDIKWLFPRLKAPTLLIWGENDGDTPLYMGKTMEKMMFDAGLVVLKNAGHYAYLDKFNEFIVIISKFLEKDMVENID